MAETAAKGGQGLTYWTFTDSFTMLLALYIVNLIVIFIVIFVERRSPSATLAWIMVLTFIPVIGIIFYLVFNQNLARSKINRLSDHEDYFVSESLKQQIQEMEDGTYPFANEKIRHWKHLIHLNHVYGKAYYTQNNEIQLLTDGRQMFDLFMEDLRNARRSINIEYFIIKKDYVGLGLIDLLTEKAKEGVEVRLLIDTLGSRHINNRVLKEYLRAGGKIGYFFKPKLKIFGIRFNYRNHRKIVVIDGRIGYTGGYNIGHEYLGEKKKFGYWRDTHIRMIGDGVADLNARFALDWRFTTKEDISVIAAPFAGTDVRGKLGVQIVSSGPESPKEEVKSAFLRMITYAGKNVYIQTPYFVPDGSMVESLKMAALSGVDVRIMIPRMPDHIFVYWATYSYVGDLLRSGARVFIYDHGFLHSKTMVVDGEVSTVGSTNFDNRSFRLNFETNAFIFDPDFAGEMERVYEEDMKKGHELTLEAYERRNIVIRFKEAIARLLADIL